MTIAEALVRMRATQEFQVVMQAAEEKRPFLSPANPSKPVDEQVQRYLYSSGQMNGFEVLFNFLKGTK